ncbi:MAG: acylneuraminate cytidylyltransferase family protein [Pseudomonadota bacterium]|nr:acylneuraminate cytidylyltransferase family protein [Pseudomonadota bacterium]
MNVAVILARSGSKRIKKKNVKLFKNKPIIYWTIQNVFKSKKFSKVIVSTDDKKIAKIVNKMGVETPFLRPSYISGDNSGTKEVIDHSIKYLEKKYFNIRNIGCFYATSIFAKPDLIKKSFNLLEKKNKFVFVAKKIDPQSRRYFILNNKFIIKKISNNINLKTQDLEKNFYQDLGQFYIAKLKTWKKEKNILIRNSSAIILKNWQATDIDDVDDWKLAEKLF